MRIAVSSLLAGTSDLTALAAVAKSWQCDGLELAGLYGQVDIGPLGDALRNPGAARSALEAAGLQIAALDTQASVGSASRDVAAAAARSLRRALLAARELGAGAVLVHGAPLERGASGDVALRRCVEALVPVVAEAERLEVLLVLTSTGVLAPSESLWYVRDALDSARVSVCLDLLASRLAGDTPSLAVKRLAGALFSVRLADARLDASGGAMLTALGAGDLNLPHVLELLRGLAYCGWLTLAAGPAEPPAGAAQSCVASATAFLRGELSKPIVELTAYKGDRNAPRFAPGCAERLRRRA